MKDNIIASGPIVQYFDGLHQVNFSARIVLRRLHDAYEVGRQLLFDDGTNIAILAYAQDSDVWAAIQLFADRVTTLARSAKSNPPDPSFRNYSNPPLELVPHKIVSLHKDTAHVVATIYKAEHMPRKGEYALKLEPNEHFTDQDTRLIQPDTELVYGDERRLQSIVERIYFYSQSQLQWESL